MQEVAGHADAELGAAVGRGHPHHDLVVEREQPPGVADELLALNRERDAAAGTLDQALVERLFEALDLQRNRRLGQVELRRGAGDAAHLGDGDQRPQRRGVEVAWHGVSFRERRFIADRRPGGDGCVALAQPATGTTSTACSVFWSPAIRRMPLTGATSP